ncbi:MAG: CoA pyrophosphatase [Clostridiales Family XIII bacterium]|jgi:8-oxo-dGTP pyrophosphatase MutT (NUDIX family)|nr:CoA pyrophosphatase [Clostridiales Family XIII bacterium]
MDKHFDAIDIQAISGAIRGHVPEPVGHYRYYSVLIPLVEKNGELHILYEVRAKGLDVQPGEVSFPGGRIEPGESARDAAVRETVEELGVAESAVQVIGELNYLVTYSNFTLYSFLGTIEAGALKTARPNAVEVGETFLVPLSFFLENEPEIYVNRVTPEIAPDLPVEKLSKSGEYAWRTGESTVLIYIYAEPDSGEERVIWGMTAALTRDFIRLLRVNTD